MKIKGNISGIELGQHRTSKELAELNISKTAKGVLSVEGAMMKLHGPDQRWNVDTLETIKI